MSSNQKIDLSTLDLRELVAQSWGEGKHTGNAVLYHARWRNNDKRASFAVYADGYKDFGGSGDSGGIIDWLRREYGWTIAESFEYLRSGKLSAALPPRAAKSREPAVSPPAMRWQTEALAAMQHAESYLWSDAEDAKRIRWYLCTKRGLSEKTIRSYHLGYNPRGQSKRFYDEASGEERNLWLPAGITIPRLINGTIWAIRVRSRVGNLAEALGIPSDRFIYGDRKGEQVDKYLSLTGSKPSAVPFNGDALKRGSKEILIVEGEFDAALAQQILGDQAIVITMGSATSGVTPEWLDKLKHAPKVYSCMDADSAGQAATQRLVDALGDKHVPLRLPLGKDITEYVVDHGGDLDAWWADRSRVGQGWWIDGVPDGVRSAILTYLQPSAAPMIERLNHALNAGWIEPDHITIPICKRLNKERGWGFSTATLDRAFRSLEGVFLSKLPPEKNLTDKEESKTWFRGGNNDKKSSIERKQGRPSHIFVKLLVPETKSSLKQYAHPRIEEKTHPAHGKQRVPALKSLPPDTAVDPASLRQIHIADQRARRLMLTLGHALENPLSTPLSGEYHNAATYRRQFIRAQTAVRETKGCQRRSRKDIAATLGVDVKSVKSVLDQAGVKSEMQFENVPFTTLDGFAFAIDNAVREKSGFPRAWILESSEGIEEICYNPMHAITVVKTALAQGKRVFLRLQVASKRTVFAYVCTTNHMTRDLYTQVLAGAAVRVNRRKLRRRYVSRSFDPGWVRGQLLLTLEFYHGWNPLVDSRLLVNPDTGEVVGEHLSVEDLTNVIKSNYGYIPRFD